MAKLQLALEDLRVDSFATATAGGRAGTVQAHAWDAPPATDGGDDYLQGTFVATQCNMSLCIASCPQTCKISCDNNC
ncbi:MAG TPA: hypothetical protein VLK84_26995 [Longimicrobium sp.]|nr:hypothetical protein [Longimicrobium sp.]